MSNRKTRPSTTFASQSLHSVREQLGLNRSQLSELVETYPSYISDYENGRKSPSLPKFIEMLEKAGFELQVVPCSK